MSDRRHELLDVLLDTAEKQHAYLTEPMFHMLMDNLVETLPEVVNLMASGAAQREAEHRLRVNEIMRAGPPLAVSQSRHAPRANELRSIKPQPPWR